MQTAGQHMGVPSNGMSQQQLVLERERLIMAKSSLLTLLPELWQRQYSHAGPHAAQGPAWQSPSSAAPRDAAGKKKRKPSPPVSRMTGSGLNAGPAAALPAGAARAKRIDDIWRACSSILVKKLWQSKHAVPFLQPVDPIRLGIPDYLNVIKQPMDLRTIREKLAASAYPTPLEFRDDVRLVWRNCTMYNQPGNAVRIMGDMLSDIWERAWLDSNVEGCWADVLCRYPLEGEATGPSSPLLPAAEPVLGGPDDDVNSFVERRRIAHRLSELGAEHLQSIFDIVQSHEPGLAVDAENPEVEFTLDLDTLSAATLAAINAHLDALAGVMRPPLTKVATAPSKGNPAQLRNSHLQCQQQAQHPWLAQGQWQGQGQGQGCWPTQQQQQQDGWGAQAGVAPYTQQSQSQSQQLMVPTQQPQQQWQDAPQGAGLADVGLPHTSLGGLGATAAGAGVGAGSGIGVGAGPGVGVGAGASVGEEAGGSAAVAMVGPGMPHMMVPAAAAAAAAAATAPAAAAVQVAPLTSGAAVPLAHTQAPLVGSGAGGRSTPPSAGGAGTTRRGPGPGARAAAAASAMAWAANGAGGVQRGPSSSPGPYPSPGTHLSPGPQSSPGVGLNHAPHPSPGVGLSTAPAMHTSPLPQTGPVQQVVVVSGPAALPSSAVAGDATAAPAAAAALAASAAPTGMGAAATTVAPAAPTGEPTAASGAAAISPATLAASTGEAAAAAPTAAASLGEAIPEQSAAMFVAAAAVPLGEAAPATSEPAPGPSAEASNAAALEAVQEAASAASVSAPHVSQQMVRGTSDAAVGGRGAACEVIPTCQEPGTVAQHQQHQQPQQQQQQPQAAGQSGGEAVPLGQHPAGPAPEQLPASGPVAATACPMSEAEALAPRAQAAAPGGSNAAAPDAGHGTTADGSTTTAAATAAATATVAGSAAPAATEEAAPALGSAASQPCDGAAAAAAANGEALPAAANGDRPMLGAEQAAPAGATGGLPSVVVKAHPGGDTVRAQQPAEGTAAADGIAAGGCSEADGALHGPGSNGDSAEAALKCPADDDMKLQHEQRQPEGKQVPGQERASLDDGTQQEPESPILGEAMLPGMDMYT